MEKIEMVEKLREKTGISAEEAWTALEKNNWVLVDAMLWLETEKGVPSQTAKASSAGEDSYLPVKPTVGDKKDDDSIGAKLKKLLDDSLSHSLVLRREGKQMLRLPVLILLVLLVAAFYVVFTPVSAWLGQIAETAGWNGNLVQILTMFANFVLEFAYFKFVVFKGKDEKKQK